MKTNCKIKNVGVSQERLVYVTLEIGDLEAYAELDSLDFEKDYKLELKEVKRDRTLQQNKYLWALIREVGIKTDTDDDTVYKNALVDAQVKYEYLYATREAINSLRGMFRVIEEKEAIDATHYQYKCYYGSSKLTTEEFARLLEVILLWCTELGIPTDENLY